jgi:chorismate lyase/3-hydroxybenzoate synthase
MEHGGTQLSAEPVEPAGVPHQPLPSAPAVPAWAQQIARGDTHRSTSPRPAPHAASFETTVSTSDDAALVSVLAHDITTWTNESFDAAVEQMMSHALATLEDTPFPQPVRAWNFLPGICTPMEHQLDRYRVFNIARHRVFSNWFGQGAVAHGRIPTASCVGHHGSTLAIHLLGAKKRGITVENPRQISAFAYSRKFGPKPPCFARARLIDLHSRQLLIIGGTASVRGEESVYTDSLEGQILETSLNLASVAREGRRLSGHVLPADRSALEGTIATRIYHRNTSHLSTIKSLLPPSLSEAPELECIHADICRPELLVEIELVVDLSCA